MIENSYLIFQGGMPNHWSKKNDVILSNSGVVTISEEISKNNYATAVKIKSLSPCSGIEQNFESDSPMDISCNLNNITGRSFINLAKNDDSSAFMNINQIPNYSFANCRGVNYIRLKNGKRARVFTLSNTGELSSTSGQIYIQIDDESPRILDAENGVQQLMSTFIQYSNKEIIIYHKIINGYTRLSMIESTDSFTTISRHCDILTHTEDVQAYSMIKCKNGMTLIPYLKATNGVYYLDILKSNDNFNTWETLNQFRVAPRRGLMETKALEIDNNTVMLLSRTELGYLAKNTLDLSTMTLSEYTLTSIATTSTAFSLAKVDDNNIALAWSSMNMDYMPTGNYNLPRMMLCLGFFNKELTEAKSMTVIASLLTHNMSFSQYLPYIHSPMIFFDKNDKDKIIVTYEAGYSDKIYSYEAIGQISKIKDLNNVANELGDNNVNIHVQTGQFKVQFLSAIDKQSTFIIDNIDIKMDSCLLLKVEGTIVRIPLRKIVDLYSFIHIYNDTDELGLSFIETQNISGFVNNNYKYELKINIDGIERTLLCIT